MTIIDHTDCSVKTRLFFMCGPILIILFLFEAGVLLWSHLNLIIQLIYDQARVSPKGFRPPIYI